MNLRRHLFWIGISLATALLLPGIACAGGLTVRTLDGQQESLADHLVQGRWTLVMVWTTYCPVCWAQYPTISAFHDKHHTSDAAVVGISLDGFDQADEVAAYRGAHHHSFPSVLANVSELAQAYERATGERFTGTPTYLLFDRAGKLTAYVTGPVTLAALEQALLP